MTLIIYRESPADVGARQRLIDVEFMVITRDGIGGLGVCFERFAHYPLTFPVNTFHQRGRTFVDAFVYCVVHAFVHARISSIPVFLSRRWS